MSGLRDTLKGGWHPKGKDGKSKESWRGDFKGINQVAGWMGKGKDHNSEASEHVSRPLSELKDPSAFGPPPKNVNYHGGAALPNQITPDTRGLGQPLSQDQLHAKHQAEEEAQREAEEAAKPKPPPVPYRANTTGLSTSHLPPPPGRKDGADGRSPVPEAKPKPPGLPPRLPPRQNSNSTPSPPPPSYSAATVEPDAHKGILNQGSLNRLGAAGISVEGFGIGGTKGKQPLPPPAPSSPSRSPVSTAPSVNPAQVNELQSRFSRLSSSLSPKAESPSEGTSWAQKQAAWKTASSFRNDPSSVSLNDAKTAASTANNFRERHGEQAKSGWQSANKLNTKYGIADKVGAYGGISNTQSPEPASPQIEMRDNTSGGLTNDGAEVGPLGKKKPPPPPVKKAELAGHGVSKEATPPPIPLSSRPKPEPSSTSNTPDLDLDLGSLWFTKSPIAFPPGTINRKKINYTSSSGWSSVGPRKTYTFTTHILHTDTLASTKIHLTWDGSNPGYTVRAQQKHYPPPRKLSKTELEKYRERYSNATAAWCESKMGRQVGNGECWTLAHDALAAVGAMPSQSLIHGSLLYTYIPPASPEPQGGILEAGVARGDVIQLLKAHFQSKDGSQKWAGNPDHTAVVTAVEPNSVLRVVEQNSGGVKVVKKGSYDVSELVKGEVRIFRAVSESWVGKLDAKW